MKSYFIDNGIKLKWFANKYGLEYTTLSRVVNGKLDGSKSSNKNTKKIFLTLFELGIIDSLPQGCKN